ncbi:MAG: diguanylate cyclase [Clostridia bacterium]|nr:diguanylate cyclase [Clostridia bacterium]
MKKRLLFFILLIILPFLLFFQPTYANNEPRIDLDGLWKYHFGDDPSYSEKYFNDKNWDYTPFTLKRIEYQPEKQNKVVWFRKQFFLPSVMPNENLMIYIGSLTNHEVYINGHFIGRNASDSTHYFNDWNRKHAYPIPSALLHLDDNNVVAIKSLSSYEYGSTEKIYIGDVSSIYKKVQLSNIIIINSYCSLSVAHAVIALYFFMFYYKSRITKKHLYFAFVCLFTSIYYTNYFIYYLPISYTLFQKVVFTSFHLGVLAFMPFLKYFFEMNIRRYEKWIFYVFALISISGAFLSKDLVSYFIFRSKYLILVEAIMVYYVALCVISFFTNRRALMQLAAGTVVLILCISHDIYYEIIGTIPHIGFFLNGYAFILFLSTICIQLLREYTSIYAKASTDGLTTLYNQSYLINSLTDICDKNCTGNTYSLLMLDIDHFKSFNDTYGHLTGDFVLKEVAKTLRANCGEGSLVARYGGEEFSVLLKEHSENQAIKLAEKLRLSIESHEFQYKECNVGKVTISIGVVTFPSPGLLLHPEILIEKADKALYYSKEHGRNRVSHFRDLIENNALIDKS